MEINKLLNSSERIVGLKQVLRKLSESQLRCVIVAEDADIFIKNKIVEAAKAKDVEIIPFSSMKKLGELCEIDVSATVVGLMD